MTRILLRRLASHGLLTVLALALLSAALLCPSAMARIYGTYPLNISVGPHGELANGSSGGPAISGDNRKARLAAFHSDASNLVGGDSNGVRDVFVWHRPHGRAGLRLNHLGAGSLKRASVSSHGVQANGASQSAELDGSLKRSPHCVVFQSQATNLSPRDASPDWDIYLRDLRRKKTRLLSAAATAPATTPTISGDCRRVAFESNGHIWTASTRTGRAHRGPLGGTPDFSLDGKAIAWQNGGTIELRRKGRTVAIDGGSNPQVSDATNRERGVTYDSGGQAMLAIVSAHGHVDRRPVTSGSSRATSISAFAPHRGIVTFIAGDSLYYLNRHTGNTDDLAHAYGPIGEGTASARANFAAFTASGGDGFIGNTSTSAVFFKHLVDGAKL
ncbi:MAG: TolB family protein [Solirubrobacterales bacterium]